MIVKIGNDYYLVTATGHTHIKTYTRWDGKLVGADTRLKHLIKAFGNPVEMSFEEFWSLIFSVNECTASGPKHRRG